MAFHVTWQTLSLQDGKNESRWLTKSVACSLAQEEAANQGASGGDFTPANGRIPYSFGAEQREPHHFPPSFPPYCDLALMFGYGTGMPHCCTPSRHALYL